MRASLKTVFVTASMLLAYSAPAEAVAFLTFVSATGNDANPCTVQANPCKTLQRAINVTSPGGQIRILTNLPAQLATVAASLTIDGGGNTMIGALTINNSATIATLRNLNLSGRGVLGVGINIVNGTAVHIQTCTVERYTQDGIRVAGNISTKVFVTDSISRGNESIGLAMFGPSTARLSVDNSRFENNSDFGLSVAGGHASITRSVASGNNDGFVALGGKLSIHGTTASTNSDRGFDMQIGSMTLSSSTAQGNVVGLFVEGGRLVRASNTILADNTSFGINGNGTVESDGTNVVDGNGTDVGAGVTIDPLNLE